MKKEYITTGILIASFIVFCCWVDNERIKQIDNLKYELENAQNQIQTLKDNNLFLNFEKCVEQKNTSAECEKIKKEIAFRSWLEDKVESTYKENFGSTP